MFGGQAQYAQRMVDERGSGVKPLDAWIQSFYLNDVLHWIGYASDYGGQAVYLVD